MVEKEGTNIPLIVTIGVVSGFLLLVVTIGIEAWFYRESRLEELRKSSTAIWRDATTIRLNQQAKITGPGPRWVNLETQEIMIPIDQAIEIIAERGAHPATTRPSTTN